jgi:GDP-L-fucose synthase
MDLADQRILITGGTGMIGRELTNLLLLMGAKLRVVSLDTPIGVPSEVEFINRDLTVYENCLSACADMDYVFNLVGVKGSASASATKPLSFFVPMIRYNTNMMEAAFRSNVEWFLYTSSIGVYANHAGVSHEDDVWATFPSENDKLPGWAKRIGELQAQGYATQHNWSNISIVRPANVYGSFDNFDDPTAMVIPSLIAKASKQHPLSVWGDGTPIRDFIHARDVARGMIHMVQHEVTEPVNLGSGCGVQIRHVARLIADTFGIDLEFDLSKPVGDPIRVLDSTRSRSYGFETKVPLERGIHETIEWYLTNRPSAHRYDPFADG